MIVTVLLLGRPVAKDCLQPFPLTFNLHLFLEPSFHDVFHIQSFQIAILSETLVLTMTSFSFREREILTRDGYLGLMGVQGNERLLDDRWGR